MLRTETEEGRREACRNAVSEAFRELASRLATIGVHACADSVMAELTGPRSSDVVVGLRLEYPAGISPDWSDIDGISSIGRHVQEGCND